MKIVFGICPDDRHIHHPRSWRSPATPGDELVKLFSRSFGDDLDRAIAAIHHPSGYLQLPGLLNRRRAKIDSLYSAADD